MLVQRAEVLTARRDPRVLARPNQPEVGSVSEWEDAPPLHTMKTEGLAIRGAQPRSFLAFPVQCGCLDSLGC